MQDKLVFFLPNGAITDVLSVGVVTTDKVASADLSAFSVCQQILILSALIIRTLILQISLLPEHKWKIIRFLSKSRQCYVQTSIQNERL
jgi:hypothetical protein